MTTSETSGATSDGDTETRSRRRRTVLIVSLVAILILGAIGASLLLLRDSDGTDGEDVEGNGIDADAIEFDDPQGRYTLDIDPAWTLTLNAELPEVESWFTGTGTDEFRDNVSIVTQDVGALDLDQYLQLVIDQAPQTVDNFSLKEFRVVTPEATTDTTDDTPTQLGVVAYDGERDGKPFSFFFVASVENGNAVLATLTTAQDRFDEVRADVEPYLMTLRQTPT